MTGPSKQDVDAMTNIMKALNGDKTVLKRNTPSEDTASITVDTTDMSPGVKPVDVRAMEHILKAFNGASQNVSKKVANTVSESVKTPNGVKVGLFSVEKTEDGYYDIRDNRTNDTLFEGLRLYESAFIITKHLNNGKKINSDDITKVLATNAVFEQFYFDAMQLKKIYEVAKKNKNIQKMDIAEARFSRAKSEAAGAKNKIKTMYMSLFS